MNKQRILNAAVAAAALALTGTLAFAQQPAPDRAAIEAQYRADRQACLSGQTMQDTAQACLYDARLAREAALKGELGGEAPEVLERNRMLRCEALSEEAGYSCFEMMEGRGDVMGSLEDGVIVREFVVLLPDVLPDPQTDTTKNPEPLQ